VVEIEHKEVKGDTIKYKEVKHHVGHDGEKLTSKPILTMAILAVVLIVFNQYQVNGLSGMVGSGGSSGRSHFSGSSDLSSLNVAELESTAQTIAAVFPLEGASGDDVMSIMFPTGTPEYGDDLGVSFDDPIESLDVLAKMYKGLKAEVEKSNPEAFQRFVGLASEPRGISCEYCCGIGAAGADSKGNSKCGCSHNPGILSLTLYLSAYTDYSDGEILREAMRWKTLWFPKNMIELGASIGGGDTSVLENLPGMVGGC